MSWDTLNGDGLQWYKVNQESGTRLRSCLDRVPIEGQMPIPPEKSRTVLLLWVQPKGL